MNLKDCIKQVETAELEPGDVLFVTCKAPYDTPVTMRLVADAFRRTFKNVRTMVLPEGMTVSVIRPEDSELLAQVKEEERALSQGELNALNTCGDIRRAKLPRF